MVFVFQVFISLLLYVRIHNRITVTPEMCSVRSGQFTKFWLLGSRLVLWEELQCRWLLASQLILHFSFTNLNEWKGFLFVCLFCYSSPSSCFYNLFSVVAFPKDNSILTAFFIQIHQPITQLFLFGFLNKTLVSFLQVALDIDDDEDDDLYLES